MKKVTLVAVGITGLMTSAALAQGNDVLYDNGDPDNTNGYSNGTVGVFGARRTVLDDFTFDSDVTMKDFHWEHIWNTMAPGSGQGLELSFRSDAGGSPGGVIANASITGYSELGTGSSWFGRPGAESWVTFDPIALGAGTYWFEATIVGPENNFWLVKSTITGSPCWVNYEDFGGLGPGNVVFGVDADLNFYITGTPALGALALLGLAGIAGGRRRRH